MKLTELGAQFYGDTKSKGRGVLMECPCGKCGEERMLAIEFENPIEGPKAEGSARWTRTGDTIETLTLRPSIKRLEGCKWHGFITDGEARPC